MQQGPEFLHAILTQEELMIRLLISLVLLIPLTACGSFKPLPTTHTWEAPPSLETAKTTMPVYFRSILKDPSSATYDYGSPFKGHINEGLIYGGDVSWVGWVYPVRINAKNSYGGYTGATEYYVMYRGNNIFHHMEAKVWHFNEGSITNRDR